LNLTSWYKWEKITNTANSLFYIKSDKHFAMGKVDTKILKKKKKQHNKPRKKMGCGNTKNQRWANNFEEFKSMKQLNRTKQHSIDAQQI